MNGLPEILVASWQVFGIILLGGILRRTGILPSVADGAINRMILLVFYPALIFSNLLGNPALDHTANLLQAPLAGALTVSLGYAACRLAAPLLRLREGAETGTFTLVTGMYNYGFIPLPLAMALFDEATVGALFLHNIGVEVMLWTAGICLVTGRMGWRDFRRVFNAPLAAIVAGVGLTVLGWEWTVPAPVVGAAGLLGGCTIPVALIMIGAFMADAFDRELVATRLPVSGGACLLRLGLLPMGILFFSQALPVSVEVERVMILQAAMPTAVFPVVLARQFGGDVSIAARCAIATSLASVITMPLWVAAGLKLLAV